jgi:hypothetical protein
MTRLSQHLLETKSWQWISHFSHHISRYRTPPRSPVGGTGAVGAWQKTFPRFCKIRVCKIRSSGLISLNKTRHLLRDTVICPELNYQVLVACWSWSIVLDVHQCSSTGLSKPKWCVDCLWFVYLKDPLGSFEKSKGISPVPPGFQFWPKSESLGLNGAQPQRCT